MLTSFHTKIVTEWNGLRRNHKIISEIGPVWFFWSKNAQIFQKMVLLCIYANTQHHPFFLHSKCENDLRSFVLNHFRVTWQLNICENKRCETLSNNVKLIRFTNKSSFEVILNPLLTSEASYYTPLTCLTFFLYLVGARLGLFSGLKRKLENFSSKNGESMHHHHGIEQTPTSNAACQIECTSKVNPSSLPVPSKSGISNTTAEWRGWEILFSHNLTLNDWSV